MSFQTECTVRREGLNHYDTLMRAADYNAMTSLYEPHGGAFEGSVVPIVRLIDGLARQVNALEPTGAAFRSMRSGMIPGNFLPDWASASRPR